MGKFIISRWTNGEYQFNLKANNNQVILASEGYTTLSACLAGIQSVKENSSDDSAFDRMSSSNGKCYFNVKALNGEIIGTSELYESRAGMETGINSVKANASDAEVEYKPGKSRTRDCQPTD